MALVPDQKFSTFQNGGTPTTGDIIVGLRGGINTKFNWVLPAGVDAITGTANQVLVNGSSGVPVTGNATLSAPQDIAPISSPTFNNLQLTGAILGSNGNTVVGLQDAVSAVNYIQFTNTITANGPGIVAAGTDPNIALNIHSKGTGPIGLITATLTQPLFIYNGTSNQHLTRFNMANTAADRTVTWQDASGTVAFTENIPVQGTTLVTTTPYAVLESDDILLVDTATIAAPSSIVLPAAPSTDGQVWTIKDYGFDASTYHITISVAGGGIIDFQSTYTLADDDSAVSIAWSSSEAAYYVVSTFDTLIPILSITANSGAANPSGGIISILGGTTGLTTSGSGHTINLTGILIPANGGTGVNNGSSTLTLAGNLATVGAFASTFTMTGITGVTFPTSGTLATTSQLPTPAALTKTDDANVTITLGGTPATALLQATSLTLGWTGTLSGTRGGTGVNNGASTFTMGGNVAFSGAFTFAGTITGNTAVTFPTSGTLATTSQLVTPAALTKTDDTNVTLTLGGSPSTALVNAASLTLGWSGQLAVSRGGTGISSFGTGVATALGQNVTGSGGIALVNSPTFVTPVLGAASATSINFGGNTLNTYTDSTFTPTMTCGNPGDLSVAYSNAFGTYVRIGSIVHVNVRFSFTPTFTTASGQVRFAGLPFATVGTGGLGWSGSVTFIAGNAPTWPVGVTSITAVAEDSSSYVFIAGFGTAIVSSSLQMSGLTTGNTYTIGFTVTYRA